MNEHHKNHKLMWNELARTGGGSKHKVITILGLPNALASCYACESMKTCAECPIEWVEGVVGKCAINEKSPYLKWFHAKTLRTRKKYAKIIANMKWRTKK
jgi:hypothetical protein